MMDDEEKRPEQPEPDDEQAEDAPADEQPQSEERAVRRPPGVRSGMAPPPRPFGE